MTVADFDQLWDYDDPVASEQRFRELLPAAIANGSLSLRVQLLTQIGRAPGLARDA